MPDTEIILSYFENIFTKFTPCSRNFHRICCLALASNRSWNKTAAEKSTVDIQFNDLISGIIVKMVVLLI